jgi:periplasmic protein TonB
MEVFKNPKKRKALLGALFFHLVLLLLFMFYGLKEPNPPFEEPMVEISMADFGFDDAGSGEVNAEQAETEDTPVTQPITQPTTTAQPEQPVETQTQESEHAVPESKEEAEPVKEEKPERTPDPTKLFPSNTQSSESGQGGDGDDDKPGNKGSQDGKEGQEGTAGGSGFGFSLAGRSMVNRPQIQQVQEEGVVVLDIWVNRQGVVTRTNRNFRESNTTSDKLFTLAEQAIKDKKIFDADPNGPIEAKGTIRFPFILK